MIRYVSDRSNRQIPAEECTTLRLDGPLKSMLCRGSIHLDKSEALALARWLGYPVARPDVPTVAGPGEPTDDADATAADLQSALRVESLQTGRASGSRPPKGGSRKRA